MPTPTLVYFSNQHITVEVENVLITIVHAHCTSVQRRQLWLELSNINPLNLSWLIMGNFNAYLSISEKKEGNNPTSSSMNDFKNFISNNQLMEVPSSGYQLTWWNKQVGRFKILGKIDRMLCNACWGSNFPSWKYQVYGRICSDHSPLLGGNLTIPQPKNRPFKFFNMWCTHPTFRDTVPDSWQIPLLGNSIFILMQKLKRLKGVLKKWNKDTFGNIKVKVEDETKKLEHMQEQFKKGNVTKEFIVQMVDQENQVELLLQQEQMFWKQKSRTKWDNDNDRSTKFFHAMANRNRSKSLITEMKNDEGITLDTQDEIGKHIVKHYFDKFRKVDHNIDWELIHNMPQEMQSEDNEFLATIPSAEEVKAAVFHLNPNSSPGPDGFSGYFFHHYWDIIGHDLVRAIRYFFIKSRLPLGFNANFIVLIQKEKNAIHLGKFCLICLSNFIFKVITKILATRLSPIAEKIISKEQYDFIPNRNSQQAIGLASELGNGLQTPRYGGSMAIKLDISQAFDTIDWNFLWVVLQHVGFKESSIKWLHAIFQSNTMSIMLNGGPHGYFSAERGLKQGDPLSPMLFALAEDCLSRSISRLVLDKKIQHMVINSKYCNPSHLMFADDIFLFCNANMWCIKQLVKLLHRDRPGHLWTTHK
ncbi:hypothetical protein IFM89_005081 [Coptis chinensis]|uniref:Reverse transcriptase domain-containing protein n=1 Tax=Coptis chinensis TaxID=261450 RepID=A0A835IMQ1_9MAGN|nr:hypothetical protein IFM89_005081 [Coptis chinensis]